MGELKLCDCFIYSDDIIIFSTFLEHLEKFKDVFSHLELHTLKLKAIKCEDITSLKRVFKQGSS